MRNPWLLGLVLIATAGCAVRPVVDAAIGPMNRKATFEAAHKRYCDDIRFGAYEKAVEQVEPEHRAAFLAAKKQMSDIRFTGYRIDAVELEPQRTHARATVVYTGYWLSSPYEREVAVVQDWRLEVGTGDWYVTPSLGTMLDPTGVSANRTLR